MVVDSYQRFIYIYGTNHVYELGAATSAGCIRMDPEKIIELYDNVPLDTHVYIY